MQGIKIFISSPGDVDTERKIAARVIERLAGEFRGRIELDAYFWEDEPMRHQRTFQEQIPSTADFDLVLCILWSRLGTPLTGPDGRQYPSGTDYEVESARAAYEQTGKPDLMIYLNQTPAQIRQLPREEREKMMRQLEALEKFIERHCFDRESGVIKGAFTTYRDLGQFEDLLEKHLRKLILAKLPVAPPEGASVARAPLATWHERPYRGLQVFDFEHAPIFFGRTRAAGEVLALLRQRALRLEEARTAAIGGLSEGIDPSAAIFVLVCAMSGVGKSSLIRAGVLPLLVQPGGGIGLWRRVVLRPSETPAGGDLFDALIQELTKANGLPELLGSGGGSREELAFMLRQNPAGIALLLKQALSQAAEGVRAAKAARLLKEEDHCREAGRLHDVECLASHRAALTAPPARLAVVIDQMEELFTLDRITPELRRKFVSALAAVARTGSVWVIGTLRSDFFARCAELPELMELKAHGLYDLQPPTPEELGQMIRCPAAVTGLRFGRHAISDAALDEALRDVAMRSPKALPLLEFALDQLHNRRTSDGALTWEAYEAIGGLEGALATTAEETLQGLKLWQQETFDHVFSGLMSSGGAGEQEESATRRTADYEALAAPPGARAFVDAFIAARLFVADRDTVGQAIVSVAHEALLGRKMAPAVVEAMDTIQCEAQVPATPAAAAKSAARPWLWTRLGQWIEANADFLRMRARVSASCQQWEDAGQDAGFLLQAGRPLLDGETLLRKRTALSAQETDYILRSVAAETGKRRRRARVRATVIAGLALLTLGASVGAWFGFRGKQEAQQQRQVAQVNEERAQAGEAQMRASVSRSNFYKAEELAEAHRLDESMTFLAHAVRTDPANYAAARRIFFLLQLHPWFMPEPNGFPADIQLLDTWRHSDGSLSLLGCRGETIGVFDEHGRVKGATITIDTLFGVDRQTVDDNTRQSIFGGICFCDQGQTILVPGNGREQPQQYRSTTTGEAVLEPESEKQYRRQRNEWIRRADPKVQDDDYSSAATTLNHTKTIFALADMNHLHLLNLQDEHQKPEDFSINLETEKQEADGIVTGSGNEVDGVVFSPRDHELIIYGGDHGVEGRSRPAGSLLCLATHGQTQWKMSGFKSPISEVRYCHDESIFVVRLADGSSYLYHNGDPSRLAVCTNKDSPLRVPQYAWVDYATDRSNLIWPLPDPRQFMVGATRWRQIGWPAIQRREEQDKPDDPTSIRLAHPVSIEGTELEKCYLPHVPNGWENLRPAAFLDQFHELCDVAKAQGKVPWRFDLESNANNEELGASMVAFLDAKRHLFAIIEPTGWAGLWNTNTGKLIANILVLPGTRILALKNSALWLRLPDGRGQLRNLINLDPLGPPIPLPSNAVMSADAKYILIADTYVIRKIDARSGATLGEPIPAPFRRNRAMFAPDGSMFITDSVMPKDGYSIAQVWDTESLRSLHEPICSDPGEGGEDFLFGLDGALFLLSDQVYERYPLPDKMVPSPNWLPDIAEAISGFRIGDNGVAKSLTPAERQGLLHNAQEQIDAQRGGEPWAKLFHWWLDESDSRTIAPDSPVKVKDYHPADTDNTGNGH